jgi:hypothetical protein
LHILTHSGIDTAARQSERMPPEKGTDMPSISEGGILMKRYSLGLVLLMVLALGTAAFAVFPVPDSTATFTVQQGFGPDGQLVWFFCTDTNSVGMASFMQFPYRQMTLAAPLSSLYNPHLTPGTGINTVQVYFNTGFQQGPIFPVLPGSPHY